MAKIKTVSVEEIHAEYYLNKLILLNNHKSIVRFLIKDDFGRQWLDLNNDTFKQLASKKLQKLAKEIIVLDPHFTDGPRTVILPNFCLTY